MFHPPTRGLNKGDIRQISQTNPGCLSVPIRMTGADELRCALTFPASIPSLDQNAMAPTLSAFSDEGAGSHAGSAIPSLSLCKQFNDLGNVTLCSGCRLCRHGLRRSHSESRSAVSLTART